MKKLKQRIFQTIEPAEDGDLISKVFDLVIIGLIVVNISMVIAETFTLPEKVKNVFSVLEVVSVAVFSLEYALRVWTANLLRPELTPAKARLRYVFSFMALMDLLAILPFYVPFIIPVDLRVLRTLRVTRLLRLFKVNRYTSALTTIGKVFKRKGAQLVASMFIVALLMLIAAVLMYNIENAAQPNTFRNAFDALWWAIATLTTIGYGDIYPITVGGKILSSVIAILGIGLIAVPTGIISAGFMETIESPEEKENPSANEDHTEKCYCPYCGKRLDK